MFSKIGWMLSRYKDRTHTLFVDKSINGGQKNRERYIHGEISGHVVHVPQEVIENPQSADFVWSTLEDAVNADREISEGGAALVRVEALWYDDSQVVMRPDGDGDVHIIPEDIVPLYSVYANDYI